MDRVVVQESRYIRIKAQLIGSRRFSKDAERCKSMAVGVQNISEWLTNEWFRNKAKTDGRATRPLAHIINSLKS